MADETEREALREASLSRSGESGRDIRGAVIACVATALLACLVLASSASALSQRGHVFGGSFPSASAALQLKEPAGVAVNEATGDVYVVDSGNNRVVEFGPAPAHKFIRTWGWGVKTGAKQFEVCEEEAKCHVGIAGHAAGELHGAEGIAVDQSTNKALDPSAGDVYVETVLPYEEEVEGHEREFENTIIEKFQPNGEPVAKGSRIKGYKEKGFSTELFEEEVHGLTVGVGGNLFIYNEESVIEYSNEEPNKFKRIIKSEAEGEGRYGIAVDSNPTAPTLYLGHEGPGAGEPPTIVAKEKVFQEGEEWIGEPLIEALNGEPASDVAVDEANNDPLVDNVESVSVYDTSGEFVERFGQGHLQRGSGIAPLRSGDVLVADSAANVIDLFEAEPPAAPQIDELSVAEISSSVAVLGAQIDPTGLATKYTFRYDTGAVPKAGESCTGSCIEVPVPAGELAAAFADDAVSQKITGLAPATLYHYTVIASNSSGTVEATEQKFHTQAAVLGKLLPDNRRWELVSPLQKNGAAIEAPTKEGGLIESSEDGERLTYVATGAFPGAEGNRAPEVTQVLATRGEKEWSNTDVDTKQVAGQGVAPGSAPEYRFFSSDLSSMIVQPFGNKPRELYPLSPEAGESTPYLRSASSECLASPAPTSCFDPVLTSSDVPAETEVEGKKLKTEYGGQTNFVDADPGLTHLILQTSGSVALSAEPAGSVGNLYEFSEGAAHLVSILPNGKPAGEKPANFTEVQEAPELGAKDRNIARAVSTDGSRVIWTTYGLGQAIHLFVRDMATGETVRVDEPQAGAEQTAKNAHPLFQTASADGSHIFFTDAQRLTTDSTASAEEEKPDLYDCHLVENETSHKLECKLTDLTVDSHAGQTADVQGLIPGAGSDGNTVYFVANGALTGSAAPGHCVPNEASANEGKFRLTATCNLYVDRFNTETQSWAAPQLIGALSAEDEPDWDNTIPGSLTQNTTRVSPDGNYLTFVSDRSLTGYHNTDVKSGKPDTEVFLYNAGGEQLTCVSCNPTGARPTGVFDTELAGEGRGLLVDRPLAWSERWLSGTIPAWTHLSLTEAPYPSRVLFDNGRMFFMSAESLVPQDTNGKEDVYEFEPPGVGGCTTESETYGETSGGCVSLISSGSSANESTFLDASATGNDVFILTSAKLAPADTDTNFDVYDATICGQPGSHECLPTPAASPPPCESIEGENPCRSSSTEPGGAFAPPGSKNVNGSTNSSAVEVLGSKEAGKTTTTTNAQKLAKAITACKKLSNKSKRATCEKAAVLKYGTKAQKLSATLKACRKVSNHKKRKSCETAAHKKYGTAKSAAHGAKRSR